MIYDCFTFFNEFDLLEIRLNALKDVVDRFVLVEATKTFSNLPKPLHFEENKGRFTPFLDRIIHVVVDDFPEFDTAWTFENHQRNAIDRGLTECKDDDVVLISDLDEIPKVEAILAHKNDPGITIFEQLHHCYYLNHLYIRRPNWHGTRMLSGKDFRHALDHVSNYGSCNIERLNQGTTANKIRTYDEGSIIKDAGWHFSYLGGLEAIRTKIQSYSHQERNYNDNIDLKNIERRMSRAFKSHRLIGLEIDESYPQYLRENQEKYASLIGPITPKDKADWARKTAWLMAYIDRGSYLAAKLLTCMIPNKKLKKMARVYVADKLFGWGW